METTDTDTDAKGQIERLGFRLVDRAQELVDPHKMYAEGVFTGYMNKLSSYSLLCCTDLAEAREWFGRGMAYVDGWARLQVEVQRAVVAEREQCAKICDSFSQPDSGPIDKWTEGVIVGAERCADEIRKQGRPEPISVHARNRNDSITRFALRRFAADARAQANAAAQDKAGRLYKPGAVEAFLADAKDAEAILATLPQPPA